MFGNYSPATASVSTVSHTANNTPASPTRPSRLRGLSYLRSYTHNHLHSHSQQTSSPPPNHTDLSTSTSPSRAPRLNRSTSSPARSAIERTASPPLRSDAASNGWAPSVAGQSGLSRVATQPQSTQTNSSSPAMTRTRAATAVQDARPTSPASAAAPTTLPTSAASGPVPVAQASQPATSEKKESPTIRFIPHHEPRSARPSLTFPIVTRTINATGQRVKVGRYSERDQATDSPASAKTAAPVGFKSKVVSRRHCELWCDNGQWFIKDVKSSSGTFLNHVRLSSPGMESRAYPLNDGDIVQLGIDFKGGEEVIFRCVKIRIECNRGWQKSLNQFNTATHKNLLKQTKITASKDSDAQSTHSSECSICLNPVAPCQALFVAPCSHVWHYKCVRTLIYPNWPSFQCPNCRAYADLEADVEPPEEEYESGDDAVEEAIKASQEETPQKSSEPETLPAIHSSTLEDEELTTMLNSASVRSASPSPNISMDSSSDGEAGPSRGSISQPVPIAASTNAPVNRILSDSIMARSATPTSTAPFALGDGQNTPSNDAGPFLFENTRRPVQESVLEMAREPAREGLEEHR